MRRGHGRVSTRSWSGDISWHEEAACRGLGDSADVWFALPDRQHSTDAKRLPPIRKALAVCWSGESGCPVRVLCWQQAANDPHAEGVWGGEYWPADWTTRRNMARRGPIRRNH